MASFVPPSPWYPVPPGLNAAGITPGSVWLVGAGPGDPGLLTLHAALALTQADVVLHDALVPSAILALAGQARLESVGKRAGRRNPSQIRIGQRLVRLAREGLRVVRLKGGDPLIFGRGGEEALALAAAGIPFRIIPGISAGLGGTATAGLPLTHRGLARSVSLVTGHDMTGEATETDWASLAQGSDVLVLYMARRQIARIVPRLCAAGRSPAEPVAIIANATMPDQVVRHSVLNDAAAAAAALPSDMPVLFVIGPVVPLRAMIADWLQFSPMTPADRAPAPARSWG